MLAYGRSRWAVCKKPNISFNPSQSLVQAILIMGGEWMGRVRNSLDELEESMNAVEIKEDDLNAVREEEKRHKVNSI